MSFVPFVLGGGGMAGGSIGYLGGCQNAGIPDNRTSPPGPLSEKREGWKRQYPFLKPFPRNCRDSNQNGEGLGGEVAFISKHWQLV